MDGTVQRELKVPKGDIFHQFRQDVQSGNLPTVSWLAAPENFSDHPASAWYGAWYVSEALDILTQNPEVWKKTIFILTYDENDGYFDHVPPFVAHHPDKPDTGKASGDIDTSVEYVKLEQELQEEGLPKANARGGPIGLGYRVPLVIASPWSRGGYVCSEVFEHTSSLQFLEDFINKKYGKQIKEPNITAWRRMVSGNLTAAFRPYKGETITQPAFLQKDVFLESIHKAQFKQPPADFKKLSAEEITQVKTNLLAPGLLPQQEKGTRPANALRYELYAEGKLSDDKKIFSIELAAANNVFGAQAKGSPFNVYAANNFRQQGIHFRSYAVAAGDKLSDNWAIADFDNGAYHLSVHGPNGFYRAFTGNAGDPSVDISCTYERNRLYNKLLTGNIILKVTTADPSMIEIKHNAYGYSIHNTLAGVKHNELTQLMDLNKSFGWYDFTVKIKGNDAFERRFAGHVDSGKESMTDPAMGGV
jgi:phospholipase C